MAGLCHPPRSSRLRSLPLDTGIVRIEHPLARLQEVDRDALGRDARPPA